LDAWCFSQRAPGRPQKSEACQIDLICVPQAMDVEDSLAAHNEASYCALNWEPPITVGDVGELRLAFAPDAPGGAG
jgi:hypothetical protein